MPFLIPVIAVALGGGALATIGASLIVAAIAVGVSYAANKFLTPEGTDAAEVAGGLTLDLQVDSRVPQSVLLGTAVTAGSLVYAESYGETGAIKNSDLIQIIALGDTPIDSLVDVYIDGRRVTLDGAGNIAAFNDLVNIKFYDGSQTTVDTLAAAKLGGHAKRGWANTATARGRAYARVHYKYDPKRVTGPMGIRFVVKGMKLYDPRKDTSVGGSGSQTFASLASHTWTDNLAVIAYNVLRGIRANSDAGTVTVYGIDDTPAAALPLDVWFAAMNACDNVGGTFGGTMLGGAEIPVTAEPLATIREILKSCNGRLVEAGGIYKLYIGNPGAAVVTISDGDILANEDETFDPILPLAQKINTITGSYTSKPDGWVTKIAPPRRNAALITSMGRRVAADLEVPWVQTGNQIQRLMKAMLAEAGRERRHVIALSRQFFALEPGDVIAWNSTRNGYTAKLFRIDTAGKSADLANVLSITELDPTDYDWIPADEIAEDLIDTEPDPIPSKAITGLIASAIDIKGDTTTRAAIQLTFTDPLDLDIVAMEAQYRVSPAGAILTSSSAEISDLEMTVISGIQHQTTYDIRARFVSYEGYECPWSAWLTLAVGDVNVGGAITITTYLFDTNTTAADPGGGKLRLNAATWATATKIYVDDLASAGPDYSAFFLKMVAGDTVRIQVGADATRYAKYILTAPPIDHVGWFEFNVSVLLVGAGAMPANGNSLAVTWAYGTAAGTGGPPPANSVGPLELQDDAVTTPKIKDLNITAAKVKTTDEFSGQFWNDKAGINGPPAGTQFVLLINNLQITGRTTVCWAVAGCSGSSKVAKNKPGGSHSFSLIAVTNGGSPGSLSARVISAPSKAAIASGKTTPYNVVTLGSVNLSTGGWDIYVKCDTKGPVAGQGWKCSLIGQAPKA